MARAGAVILEENVRIPLSVRSLAEFRAWAHSPEFPQRGRVDYLGGDIEVDMSPEDLFTHGAVKSAIAAALHSIVVDGDRGQVFVDSTRVSTPGADLSAEPDVLVLLFESVVQGRVRLVPAATRLPDRFVEIEGAPDLVVEVLSDGSIHKDRERLPRLYAEAGISELWLVDARGHQLVLELHVLEGRAYRVAPADPEGWTLSPVLGLSVRLRRSRAAFGWRYRLECVPTPA